MYLDVKRFLYNYIENRKRKDYGYDLYKKDLFISLIKNNGFSLEQQYLLFNYLKRIFDGAYFDSEWIETEFLQIKLKIFKHSNKLKYVLLWSSQSIRNILFTLGILYLGECLIFLPSFHPFFELFNIKFVPYSDCSVLNYPMNVLAWHIDWIDGPKVYNLTLGGVLLFTFWYIAYIVFVVNFLFKNFLSNLKINDAEE